MEPDTRNGDSSSLIEATFEVFLSLLHSSSLWFFLRRDCNGMAGVKNFEIAITGVFLFYLTVIKVSRRTMKRFPVIFCIVYIYVYIYW